MTSPYASVGATLVDNGYSAIPCMPGSKFPGNYAYRKWHAKLGWNQYGDRLPTEHELTAWEQWPDAGVCLVLDHHIKVVDIDTDDPELLAAILPILPESTVKKRGQKGFSAFYRGSPDIQARGFNLPGYGRVIDLLAYGKQTVIPPTVHPGTGRPYVWVEGSDDLLQVAPEDLPELPDDIAAQLEEALAPFGYLPPVERDTVFGDADTAWREVNQAALSNLEAWVPHLGLEKLSRVSGGYRAVASHRPSNSGKPTSARSQSLGINENGIVDWGDDDRKFTPIDLVMVLTPCDFGPAFEWLRDKLGLGMRMDFSKLIANGLAKSRRVEQANPLTAPDLTPAPEQDNQPDPQPIRAPVGEINPFDYRTHGGLMGQVSRWMFDSAWRPVPEFATIGAIGVMASLFGRRYTTPTGLGLNLYLIGLGGAGFGKDHALKASQALLADAGMTHLIGPADFSSDSALEHVVRQRPCFTMPMDEIGMFFQGMSGRNSGGFEKRIRKVLLELYTRSDGMWTGKQKTPVQGSKAVTDTAAEPVYNPTISLIGMSTPSEFYEGITEQNLKDGVVARMTVVAPKKRPSSRKEREPVVPPRSLVAAMKDAAAAYPVSERGNLGSANWRMSTNRPALHQVSWESDAVRDMWREIEEWQVQAIDDDPSKDGVMSRAAEQTIKLATIRAISRRPDAPVVGEDDIEWGWAIVSGSLWAIDAGVSSHMANDPFEKLCKDIVRYLEQAGGSMPKSLLLRKRGITKEPRVVTAALKHLAEAGVVYPGSAQEGARVTVALLAVAEAA